jgi:serine/threonine-protein kinase
LSAEDPLGGTTRFLHVDVAPETADVVAGALRELIGGVPQHRALLRIIAAGVTGARPFIVTPSVAAESLDAALSIYGPAAIADALPRLSVLADALDLLGRDGVCHGMLSPEVILVSSGETWIVGAGVARALARSGLRVPVPIVYAAPEAVAGAQPSTAADQYALAAIAYEWLCGRRLTRATGCTLPGLRGVDATQLSRAFERATAADPADRFDTCRDFVLALRGGASAAAPGPSRVLPFGTPADELPLYPSQARTESPGPVLTSFSFGETTARRTVSVPVVVALALAVGLGAFAGWMFLRRTPASPVESGQEFTEAPLGPPDAGRPSEAPTEPALPREVTDAAVKPPPDELTSRSAPERPVLDVARASQQEAGLLVHSTPAGAVVTIDGVPRGTTPVAVRGLELGRRSVVVSRPGYRSMERLVVLTEARPSRTLEIELSPVARQAAPAASAVAAEGNLLIDSRPVGAAVFVDGRAVGVTPLVVRVPPGPHTVRFEHAGHRSVTTRVDVTAGERARVAARLEEGQHPQ